MRKSSKREQEIIAQSKIIDVTLTGEKQIGKKLIQSAQTEQASQFEQFPLAITTRKTDKVDYPLDKPNNILWKLLESDTGGQIAIAAEKRGSGKELSIFYSINFSELEGVQVSKRLTAFDKRVYVATAALYKAGNQTMSVTQIYFQMGNNKRPNTKDLEKVNNSLNKMQLASISISNADEAVSYNYPVYKYDGYLLPFERASVIINGQTVHSAIHLMRQPPLMEWAIQRKQFTTIDRKLLESPISKTEANLAIEDYLIERIAHTKSTKKMSNIIKLDTLFDAVGITDKKQKQRAPEKIRTYLNHYKEQGWIKGYEISKTEIKFTY